jgi:hypothetical protein
MSTYEIIPETDLFGNDLSISSEATMKKCRKLCDKNRKCKGFVWDDISSKCYLKNYIDKEHTKNIKGWTLYIKAGNPDYWLLWIFLAVLGIIILMYLCKRK